MFIINFYRKLGHDYETKRKRTRMRTKTNLQLVKVRTRQGVSEPTYSRSPSDI